MSPAFMGTFTTHSSTPSDGCPGKSVTTTYRSAPPQPRGETMKFPLEKESKNKAGRRVMHACERENEAGRREEAVGEAVCVKRKATASRVRHSAYSVRVNVLQLVHNYKHVTHKAGWCIRSGMYVGEYYKTKTAFQCLAPVYTKYQKIRENTVDDSLHD